MKTILVPTDFSRNARNAIQFALEIARQLNARLMLYHVYQVSVPVSEVPMVLLPDYEIDRINAKRMRALVKGIQKKVGDAVPVEGQVGNGTTVTKLVDYVKENKTDLVVMGTRGANNMLDRFMGTNTASMMKHAPCPVLAIPGKAKFKGYSEIIYASDHSTTAAVFSTFLHNLAQTFKAEIAVLHIKKDQQSNVGNEIEVPNQIRRHYPYDKYYFVEVVDESPERGIAEFVRKTNPQLLALTVRKRGLVKNFFHRSVLKQLAYELPIPILALPEESISQREATIRQKPADVAAAAS